MMTNVWNYTAPGEHPPGSYQYRWRLVVCPFGQFISVYTRTRIITAVSTSSLEGAARFFSSTTVQEPSHGWLVTAPTSSRKTVSMYLGDSVTPISICMGPTMDVQLLTELYTNVIAAHSLAGL